MELGFSFVASGPLVRSSYHAAEGFVAARLREPRIELSSASPREHVPNLPTGLIAPSALVRRARSLDPE
jgi:hypothetical protein